MVVEDEKEATTVEPALPIKWKTLFRYRMGLNRCPQNKVDDPAIAGLLLAAYKIFHQRFDLFSAHGPVLQGCGFIFVADKYFIPAVRNNPFCSTGGFCPEFRTFPLHFTVVA